VDLKINPVLPVNKTIGIGCIGAGFIMADCHLVAYRNSGFNPIAITSRSEEKSRSVATRHNIPRVYATYEELLADPAVEVLDIAVPPDIQPDFIREAIKHKDHIRGILAQKPMGVNYKQARDLVRMCEDAGITLAVNQNMRFDQSIRACKSLLDREILGRPVFASIEMRAIPHWMPWQEQLGWATIRTMSIHHLDTFRYLLGDPARVYCSVTEDPRTAQKFAHEDGVSMYILEYENGTRASAWDDVWAGPCREGSAGDIYIRWRVEGTMGMAKGTIGWPFYPHPTPSTIDYTTTASAEWISPRWSEVWFPDAFAGPMADLLVALERNQEPAISGRDNLNTTALIDACYTSFREHRAVQITEIINSRS
jgi:predicted dehydrogenase